MWNTLWCGWGRCMFWKAAFDPQEQLQMRFMDVYGVIPVGSRQEFGTILQNCLPRGIPGAVVMSVTVPLKNAWLSYWVDQFTCTCESELPKISQVDCKICNAAQIANLSLIVRNLRIPAMRARSSNLELNKCWESNALQEILAAT